MSNKFNLSNELKGYKEWIINNRKGFTVTVAGTTVVVALVGALAVVPLNNQKNEAQENYNKIMTKYRTYLDLNADLKLEIGDLKTQINDLEKENYGLQTQIQQAEQPAEEEDTEEPEEVTEEQAEIAPYVPTMEDEQALISAQQYLDLGFGFSREGMRQQLEYEGFSDTAIGYALDSLY